MNALEYLKINGQVEAEKLAIKAGTNLAYFRHIAYGQRKPSPDLARAIEKASKGEVTKEELRPDIWG